MTCTTAVRLQWKIPDDGQRNCPKHVEFYSKNKYEKLVHLVGFIIRTKYKTVVSGGNYKQFVHLVIAATFICIRSCIWIPWNKLSRFYSTQCSKLMYLVQVIPLFTSCQITISTARISSFILWPFDDTSSFSTNTLSLWKLTSRGIAAEWGNLRVCDMVRPWFVCW